MFIPLWLLILLAVWLVAACSGQDEQRQHCDALQDELDHRDSSHAGHSIDFYDPDQPWNRRDD